jgi:hypothetical protein
LLQRTISTVENPRIIAAGSYLSTGHHEASMAQEIQSAAHHPQSLQNVCLTGTVCMAALGGGLLISAIIFVKTFWLH